jgi:hypothetical protein
MSRTTPSPEQQALYEKARTIAQQKYADDDVDIDNYAEVFECVNGNVWVQAWVLVRAEEIKTA